jgi:uncharacterized protein
MRIGDPTDLIALVEAGYAVLSQDVRGRFGSGGTFVPFVHEPSDGAETIAWAAAQPWSSGRVGMLGASYIGATQWLAAEARPPALAAIAPFVTSSDYHEGWVYQGGAFQLGFSLYWVLWSLAYSDLLARSPGGPDPAEEAATVACIDALRDLYRRRPLRHQPLLERWAPYYQDWLKSNFPRFDANTNTGGVIADEGPEDVVVAVNRVYHDPLRPSHLVLPVIDPR